MNFVSGTRIFDDVERLRHKPGISRRTMTRRARNAMPSTTFYTGHPVEVMDAARELAKRIIAERDLPPEPPYQSEEDKMTERLIAAAERAAKAPPLTEQPNLFG